MGPDHTLGIFEAGISRPNEMAALNAIIQPTIGLLTNIGEAHEAQFDSLSQKLEEKLQLFAGASVVIGPAALLYDHASRLPQLFTWSNGQPADLVIEGKEKKKESTLLRGRFKNKQVSITVPFTDEASVENAVSCWCVLLFLQMDEEVIRQRFSRLHAIDMRLQLNHSNNDCLVINDSYSADITSLKIALDFLQQQSSGRSRTVILSEFFETGQTATRLYLDIAALLISYRITKLIVIGEEILLHLEGLKESGIQFQSYRSTDDFIRSFRMAGFNKEIILIKGARVFGFERIAKLFEKKLHQTVLQINLDALAHNLKEYQKHLKPGTGIMAMVKAFSYGSGGAEIASVLQYHNVNYLGVAYADEGVDLVKAGIQLPVMVMNAEASSFDAIIDYGLQPVIYSSSLLKDFSAYLEQQGLSQYPVHLELETGMNRLGFSYAEVPALAVRLAAQ
jgi:hypothetical protein